MLLLVPNQFMLYLVESSMVKRVAVELIANCNTFIIHKLNDPQDIDLLINTIGTKSSIAVTHHQGTNNSDTVNNQVSISTKTVDKPLLKAQDIRELQAGFGYVCRTVINLPPQKVHFNQIT